MADRAPGGEAPAGPNAIAGSPGSVVELAASGPAAHAVIVVETPALTGSRFDLRVATQTAVVQRVREMCRLNSDAT